MSTDRFIHDLDWSEIPDPVRHQARRSLLNTMGVAVAGRQSSLSAIVFDYVAATHGSSGARLWLDGRVVSAPGAALAHGMTVDAVDMHDTCLPAKRHAGAALGRPSEKLVTDSRLAC